MLDNPNLLVACVIGDGESETGPLSASWHSNKILSAVRWSCYTNITFKWFQNI